MECIQRIPAGNDQKHLFRHAPDFPVYDENDWYRLLTGKLIINVCINPLTALLRVKNGELLRNDAYKKYMRNVFEEAETILGLADREKAWNKVCEVCRLTEKSFFHARRYHGRQADRG